MGFLMLCPVMAISIKARVIRECFQRFDKENGSNPKAQGEVMNGGAIPPRCPNCGRNYVGEWLRGTNACFDCGIMRPKIFESPNFANKGKEWHPQD